MSIQGTVVTYSMAKLPKLKSYVYVVLANHGDNSVKLQISIGPPW